MGSMKIGSYLNRHLGSLIDATWPNISVYMGRCFVSCRWICCLLPPLDYKRRASGAVRAPPPPLALSGAQARSLSDGGAVPGRRRRRRPLPPLASRLAPSPPSSAHRPETLRTHLPLPSRLCCTVGARPTAQGGRALAPPVVAGDGSDSSV